MARSAVNQEEKNDQLETKYLTDAGDVVWHDRKEGALALAKKLLDTIKEVK